MPESSCIRPESSSVRVESNVPVPMRDGTLLYADVYAPEGPGRFPVLLQRTPYDKTTPLTMGMLDPLKAARHGFAVVIQDTRGRYTSEGEFYAFLDDIQDGYDTVEWAAAQPWSSGKVGMYGCSYVGATQWLAAMARPPHLAAIAPNVTGSNYHEGWTYQGGAFELGFNVAWTLTALTLYNFRNLSAAKGLTEERRQGLIDAVDTMDEAFRALPFREFPHLQGLADYFYDWLDHPEYDEYWKRLCVEEAHPSINVPAYNLGGWYDIFLGGTLRNFTGMRDRGATEEARRGQKLLIGAWPHGARGTSLAGGHYFGQAADSLAIDMDGIHFRWFDHWLKGIDNGIMDEPPVRIFVMGDGVWREEQEWPLSRARDTRYYLHSGGKANSLHGNGELSTRPPGDEPPDVFLYHPMDPVPTRGGPLAGASPYWLPTGAFDQREVESRQDVLVYSTPPLDADVEVTGPITVSLWAATSATDTDFTAKLVDVDERGWARNLTDGIIRARYRESTTAPSLVEPGRAYRYEIDLWSTSNVFKRGHRIRLEISSSNFPRFDRNGNTGAPVAQDAAPQPALQTVLHDGSHASHVTLPVVPR